MKRLAIICLLLLGGWTHGLATFPLVGHAGLNLGAGDPTAQTTINLFNVASIGFDSGATPAAVDAFGLPVRNFTGLIDGQLGAVFQTLSTTGQWTFAWDAGRSCFKINYLAAGTVTNISAGVTVANGSGSGNVSITGNCGVAGSVTINWNSTAGLTYQFDGGYTQWGSNTSGKFYLIRQSDQAAFNAGTFWTPEFVNFISALHPNNLRPMGWNILLTGLGPNVVNYAYRKTTSSFSFFNFSDYPPGTRCGGSTSFCTIAVSGGNLTSAATADTNLSGWTDGEQITGNVASLVPNLTVSAVGNNGGFCQLTITTSTTGLSNGQSVVTDAINGATECNSHAAAKTTIRTVDSATQITINIAKTGSIYTSGGWVGFQTLAVTGKSAPAKIILSQLAVPLGSNFGDTLASGNSSFTYNATLDVILYKAGGINNGPPLEAQVQLANLVNANFWYNIPTWASDSFLTSSANLIWANLNVNLGAKFERGNECWNGRQFCFHWMTQMALALGLAGAQDFQSLRVRLDNGNILPASNWSGALTRLDRLYCFQGGGGGTGFLTSQLQGTSLVSPGTAAYQAYAGGSAVNFNTSPNRPQDFTNNICYAPYVGGGTIMSGQSPDAGSYSPTSFDAANLNGIVTNWNGGSQSAAIATIDAAIRGDLLNRVQTVTAAATVFTTPLAHNFSQFDVVRFTASGGTAYSGLNLLSSYQILTVPTGSTFTAGQVVAGVTGSAANAGTVGSGTTSVGYLDSGSNGELSIFNIMSGWYTKYQSVVATVNATRQNGLSLMGTIWYEGDLEPSAPSTAQCTAISINSTDCATLATALLGWKNDPMASATTQYYFQTYMGQAAGTISTGAMPNSVAPTWLVLQGGGLYGLNSNFSYVAPAPYKTYDGFKAFSTPWLLKRDLDPASNDNDPMWLQKAA